MRTSLNFYKYYEKFTLTKINKQAIIVNIAISINCSISIYFRRFNNCKFLDCN
jgi:hypothetical protein